MSVNHIIEVQNLNFSYNNLPVLDNLTFSVEKGDYVGIIGPNGGGKTTLLKILVGLLKPQSGTIKIFGTDFQKLKNRSEIGYVPQRIAQESVEFPATVYEIVESGLITKKGLVGNISSADKEKINQALKMANIINLKDRLMSSLSGGQRQRVYVTRALVNDPKILILDEPFTGVDIISQKDFYSFLKNLNIREHLTILFVSHDIDTITEEIKTVLCLNRGMFCFGSKDIIHKENTIEELYGKNITHIHHSK
ncbi:MAG: metal ABC transporter ATP-binding protein [Candidatus Magasanikbacteria bacterium]|nr:metal ABC transporter ATP-binding protein [Candidatus Magasanikbacteria bacterium]